MKIKQIEITFNDDTKQSDIDGTVQLLIAVFEAFGVTATILAHEVEVDDTPKHEETPLERNIFHPSDPRDCLLRGVDVSGWNDWKPGHEKPTYLPEHDND